MSTEPFTPQHADQVAVLAAEAFAATGAAQPLLGARHQDPAGVLPLLAGLTGAVAMRDGRVAGAWLAAPSGGALAAPPYGVVGDLDAVRHAYAAAAGTWVAEGQRTHVADVMCRPPDLHDALVDLGFGHEQAYAVLPLDNAPPPRPADPRIEVVEGSLADLEDIVALAPAIGEHQVQSPVFARVGQSFFGQLREAHVEELEGAEAHYLLGRLDGAVVGFLIWYAGQPGWSVPTSGAAELSTQATAPSARGAGVGVALTEAALAAMRVAGHTSAVVDWRTTNLLSSRFWPARGFRVVSHRMSRTIDPDPVD